MVVSTLKENLIDFLYPPRCMVCDSLISTKSSIFPSCHESRICEHCNPSSDLKRLIYDTPHQSYCVRCGEPGLAFGQDNCCLICRIYPLPCDSLRSIWYYTPKIESIIKVYKYCKHPALGKFLAKQINEFISLPTTYNNLFSNPNWDIIVSIPCSYFSLRERGFDHMRIVTKELSRLRNCVSPLLALKNVKKRPSQAGLRIEKRRNNVSKSYLANTISVEDKNILLIDDVITSGSSIFEATTTLRGSGAKRVDVITIARSTNFQKFRVLCTINSK